MVSYIFSVPQELEAAAAAAAESTARGTAATAEAGASRTAWRRSENRSGLRRHGVEIVYEAVGEEGRAETAALIPVWRLSINIWNGLFQFFSTPRAMANGRNFSNISGVLMVRLKRSSSTWLRKSSNPRTPSRVRAPESVRAGMNQPNPKMIAAVANPARINGKGAIPSAADKPPPKATERIPITRAATR